jgi:hypothetical protein
VEISGTYQQTLFTEPSRDRNITAKLFSVKGIPKGGMISAVKPHYPLPPDQEAA